MGPLSDLAKLLHGFALYGRTKGLSPRTLYFYRQKLLYWAAFCQQQRWDGQAITTEQVRIFFDHLNHIRRGENNPHERVKDRLLSPFTI
jgi:hypothetical protein